jgi:hypothetical protein
MSLIQRQAKLDEADVVLAHVVPEDGLVDALVHGTPVTGLCGTVFVPTRDPDRFPLCPRCRQIRRVLQQVRP